MSRAASRKVAKDEATEDEATEVSQGRSRGLRVLTAGAATAGRHAVVVPGLGALGYLLPTLRRLARMGWSCTLLDLPGFGSNQQRGSAPTVHGIADAAARWCAGRSTREPMVLVGHSTGAQAALLAALQLQDVHPVAALVMAGPTVAPAQRSLPRLMAAAPLAYRRDSPRELAVVGDFWRGGADVITLLRSAIDDRPDRNVSRLRTPLMLTAGRRDAFAPAGWLGRLAHEARHGVLPARVVLLPGSHNNPFTHPEHVAMVIDATVAGHGARAT